MTAAVCGLLAAVALVGLAADAIAHWPLWLMVWLAAAGSAGGQYLASLNARAVEPSGV